MEPNAAREPLFAEERKIAIMERVRERKKVLVHDLVDRLRVSSATVRSDLRELEQSGLIRRTHGGAIAADAAKAGFEPDSQLKEREKIIQKRTIAAKAVEYIEEGDTVILDTGTTTLEMAKAMKDKRNVTAIVNDLEIAKCLERCPGVQVVMVGGALRRNFRCTVGPFAVHLLEGLNVDKAFLATNGFSIEKGCTTPDIAQAEVKKTMTEVSAQVILLCDSSKMETTSFVQFAPASRIDLIVTDGGIAPATLAKLAAHGCEIIVANEEHKEENQL
ncbi:DeoR/GlpR family DNA-binding transcription regulator [Cohnella cellulosilytica]|uniref:DeoR/GlpR family DNA-binding transcription regulator n=1 Tax=Cohnella cellulosilytica TaxID=986710 RepID=A0ABW2FJ64_9BACL